MWLAHALAGLAVAAWLRGGEAVVWRAVRRLLPSLPEPAGVPGVPGAVTARRWVCATVADMHAGVLNLLADPRRGPPVPVA
jgi:hypothetical protein